MKTQEAWKEEKTFYRTECLDCYDTGYIFCKMAESEPETLVFCHCDYGQINEIIKIGSIIPRWEKGKFDVVYGFKKLSFPVKNFVPSEEEKEIILKQFEEKNKKIEKVTDQFFAVKSSTLSYWRAVIHNAEEYWIQKNKASQ